MKTTPYPTPAISWLYMTEYTHDWLYNEFGGNILLHERKIISIHHLKGARQILRMETVEDVLEPGNTRWAMSAMKMDCMQLGIGIGPNNIKEQFGLTKEQLRMFVPIECPRMALTSNGVLRPWSRNTSFGRSQSIELMRFLRDKFWQAVEEHKAKMEADGKTPQTAIQLIESFCEDNNINEVYLDDLRREWQRQQAIKKAGTD